MRDQPSQTEWMDESFWPGPSEGIALFDNLQITLDQMKIIWANYKAGYKTLIRVIGETVYVSPATLDVPPRATQRAKVTKPAPRHVGPVPKTAFAKRGRK